MPHSLPPRLTAYFQDYGSFHRAHGNEACHRVGIPLIIAGTAHFAALVPLGRVAGFSLTGAELLVAAAALFYFWLDRRLGVVMTALYTLLMVVGRALPLPLAAVALAGGWALQFIGHYAFEGRSPAFLHNLLHLLIGPAWIAARFLRWI